MGILKVIEVLSNSNKSWEDATKKAVQHTSKTLKIFVQSTFKSRAQPLAGEKWMNLESI